MSRIVDLTLPIQPHWRYAFKVEPRKLHANHDQFQITHYAFDSHWFTHIDYPIHFDPNGEDSSSYPIEDWCYSDALVLDLTGVGLNKGITAEMLEKANEKYKDKHFDCLLIRTDLGKQIDWTTVDFWDQSPWLTDDGACWIRDYHPKMVGYDFPQDYDIRNLRTAPPGYWSDQPCHQRVLVEGKILQMEYMNYFWKIGAETCKICCLPINVQNTDGGQIRVIAIVED